eukprot:COSAG02_NODE_47130_length_343_cov_1.028689_2_plen_25_part_01
MEIVPVHLVAIVQVDNSVTALWALA